MTGEPIAPGWLSWRVTAKDGPRRCGSEFASRLASPPARFAATLSRSCCSQRRALSSTRRRASDRHSPRGINRGRWSLPVVTHTDEGGRDVQGREVRRVRRDRRAQGRRGGPSGAAGGAGPGPGQGGWYRIPARHSSGRACSRSGGRRRFRPGRAATSPVSWPNSAPVSRVSR